MLLLSELCCKEKLGEDQQGSNAKHDYVLRTKILDYYKGMKLW